MLEADRWGFLFSCHMTCTNFQLRFVLSNGISMEAFSLWELLRVHSTPESKTSTYKSCTFHFQAQWNRTIKGIFLLSIKKLRFLKIYSQYLFPVLRNIFWSSFKFYTRLNIYQFVFTRKNHLNEMEPSECIVAIICFLLLIALNCIFNLRFECV